MTLHTTTHYGLRAPNDDELRRNGAAAMRNMADDIDTALHTGLTGLPADTTRTLRGSTVATPNAYGWLTIAFPAASFSAAPVVVVSNGDVSAFYGHVDLLIPPTTTDFVVAVFAMPTIAAAYVRSYAEWAVNHGETTTGIATRMRTAPTGQPTLTQSPAGNVRINWIAIGPV